MSIENFTAAIKNEVYTKWLKTLKDSILVKAAGDLRSKEQTAAKTSFYVTQNQIEGIYKRITGQEMAVGAAATVFNSLMEENAAITNPQKRKESAGEIITLGNGEQAVKFESIGFGTINERFLSAFDVKDYAAMELALQNAAETEYKAKEAALQASPEWNTLSFAEKQDALRKARKQADEHGKFGYYANKGHVISVATNLLKQTRDEIKKLQFKDIEQRNALIGALSVYIKKVEADDILTSNLKQIDQVIYADYVKDSYGKYLVEFQFGVENQAAGSASASIVEEIRNLFTLKTSDAEALLKNSPTLGQALLNTQGSPSFIQMLADNLTEVIQTGKSKKKTYVGQKSEVARKSTKVVKSNNKDTISKLKKVVQELKQAPNKPTVIQAAPMQAATDLTSLLALFNSRLRDAIVKNMGTGTSTNVLNYRTGRFADSAKIQRLTESKQGMITAFYSYMRNPYGTFSTGGAQENPRSRDPKLLIAKSIRDIAAENIKNRLRAVNV